MSTEAERFPWFEGVQGLDLAQGDIFDDLRSFSFESSAVSGAPEANISWVERDAVVMTQSCDLVPEQKVIREVLLCTVWKRSDVPEFQRDDVMESIRCGKQFRYHMLAECSLDGLNRGFRIVDFSRVSVYPIDGLRARAAASGPRLRLLPPYREHLSQAFARFFMRVGLPADIPPFRKK